MKILLIDNENEIRQVLKEMILLWSDENHTIYEANGVETGLIAIQQHQPDVLLLDVEMDDGTGFDLLKRISEPMFQLIFTTGHNKYAVQAFKFSAIDYLLKPIDPIELASCLEKGIKTRKTTYPSKTAHSDDGATDGQKTKRSSNRAERY
ncbi:MAG: response regulator [Saprospiraceae bacterium]|nr:response regulator [Saprospiraceae bacterium]